MLPSTPHHAARPLTPASLRAAALAAGGYATPSLNDVLVLSNRGFTCWMADGDDVTPLTPYAATLKALHADGNGFVNLPPPSTHPPFFPALACLFLQCNALAGVTGLASLAPSLVTLDVSSNQLEDLCDLPPTLQTLRAAANPSLGAARNDAAVLAGLTACPSLATLDLAHCGLTDAETILATISALPSLRCLYLTGNPAASDLPRRTVLAACPGLTYYNDAPVFGGERAAADAWKTGGDAGARAATEAWCEAERKRVARVEDGLWAVVGDKENVMM